MQPFNAKKHFFFTLLHFLRHASADCKIDDATHLSVKHSLPDTEVVQRADELDYKSSDDWNTKTYGNIESWVTSKENVQRFMEIFPQDYFEKKFLKANTGKGPKSYPYNYRNLLVSVAAFPSYCGQKFKDAKKNDEACGVATAGLFAMAAQETASHMGTNPLQAGIKRSLYYVHEVGSEEDTCIYSGNPESCTTGLNKGRGLLQVTYDYNIGGCSASLYGDKKRLQQNPQRVAYTWLAIGCSFWFWMTPQPPKPSMDMVITNLWEPTEDDIKNGRLNNFQSLMKIINGSPGATKKPATENDFQNAHVKRQGFFEIWCEELKVSHIEQCHEDSIYHSPSGSNFADRSKAVAEKMFWKPIYGSVQGGAPKCGCETVAYATDFPLNMGYKESYCKCIGSLKGKCKYSERQPDGTYKSLKAACKNPTHDIGCNKDLETPVFPTAKVPKRNDTPRNPRSKEKGRQGKGSFMALWIIIPVLLLGLLLLCFCLSRKKKESKPLIDPTPNNYESTIVVDVAVQEEPKKTHKKNK